MTDLINHTIGRYHILEQLGQGGMAIVYKAYDTRLEREVAIKIIRSDLFGKSIIDRILMRFEREAKALARLDHPHIIKVHDFGEYKGSPYLVMQYIQSGTLKQRLGKPMPYLQAANLLKPVAEALAYAHQHGILHRDVKPSNILLTEDNRPILTDFGIAKLLEESEGHTLTGTGIGVGTPEYMAPEQGLGKEVDGRADVYGLGVVFYELVTGHKPYTADTPLAVLLKQVHDPLPRPRDFAPALPEEAEQVLFKALAKKPEDRYPNMEACATALEKLAQRDRETCVKKADAHKPAQHAEERAILVKPTPDKSSEPLIEGRIPDTSETIDDLCAPVKQKSKQLSKWLLPSGLIALGIALALLLVFGIILPVVDRNRAEAIATAATEMAVQHAEAAQQTDTAEAQAAAIQETQQAAALTDKATQQAPKTSALFEEDFEDGKTQGFTYIAGAWKIVEDETGNHVYELDNSKESGYPSFYFGTPQWKDYAIQFRVRILNPGEGWTIISFRSSESDQYIVSIDINMTSLNYTHADGARWIDITTREHPLEKNKWYDVSIEAYGEEIRVFIDDEIIINTDDTKFQTGIVIIGVGQYSYIQLDDIFVRDMRE